MFGLDPSGKLKVISLTPITEDNKIPHTHKNQHKDGSKVHIHEKDRYGVDKVENKPVDYDKQKIQQSGAGTSKKIRIQISGYLEI